MKSSYEKAISSPHWFALKDRCRARAGGKCERCRRPTDGQLDHKHYGTLGREGEEDVQFLCDRCHRVVTVLRHKCRLHDEPISSCVEAREVERYFHERPHATAQQVIDALWQCPECAAYYHALEKDD